MLLSREYYDFLVSKAELSGRQELHFRKKLKNIQGKRDIGGKQCREEKSSKKPVDVNAALLIATVPFVPSHSSCTVYTSTLRMDVVDICEVLVFIYKTAGRNVAKSCNLRVPVLFYVPWSPICPTSAL